jgi:hypothetical protein
LKLSLGKRQEGISERQSRLRFSRFLEQGFS